MEDPLAALRLQAMELLREAYDDAAGMVDAPLDRINGRRPELHRFSSQDDLVRHWFAKASAQTDIVVALGLVRPEQAMELIQEFDHFYPSGGKEWTDWYAARLRLPDEPAFPPAST
jgi:hypothetical protein